MSYTKTAVLPCTPDEAFALITEPERLRRWQTVSATVDLRAGGAYRWTVTPGHVAAGTYREIEPGRRIVFGWGWEGNPDLVPDASTVTVIVEPVDGGSRVTLQHEGLTEQQAELHAEGWEHYFERLEAAAVKGDAGQDEWAWAPEQLDALVAAEAALAALQPVLRNLTPEHRELPTPCADLTCHQLVDHLMVSLQQLGAMAGGSVTIPEQGSAESRVSETAAQAIDAWRSRGLDGTVPGPAGAETPASFLAGILPIELVLHGWDIAQSTGQPLRVSDEVVGHVAGLAEGVVPGGRQGGSFGPEQQPAPGASALDRLAAFAGRTPIAAA